ncbi:hypothetical protein [Enterococcus phage vB_Efs19_KEN17]
MLMMSVWISVRYPEGSLSITATPVETLLTSKLIKRILILS